MKAPSNWHIPEIYRPKRRWLQFRLRMLILAIAVVSIIFALVHFRYIVPYRIESDAIVAIRRAGGNVSTQPGGPVWVQWLLGDDTCQNIVFADVSRCQIDDADIIRLLELPQLKSLVVGDHNFNSDELDCMRNSESLRLLVVDAISVTSQDVATLRVAIPDVTVHKSQRSLIALLEEDRKCTVFQNWPVPENVDNSVPLFHRVEAKVVNVHSFSNSTFVHLASLTSLEELVLSHTRPTDSMLATLKNLPSLRALSIVNTRISDSGIRHLRGCNRLEKLYMGYNSRITDDAIVYLQDLPNLRTLQLNSTGISDSGLERISKMNQLERLMLESSPISNAGMRYLKDMDNLKSLSLKHTRVGDVGLNYLCTLPNLETLNLDYTKVSEIGVAQLRSNKNLRYISVAGTGLNAEELESHLPHVHISDRH